MDNPIERAAVKTDDTPAGHPTGQAVGSEEQPKQVIIEVDSVPSDAEVWLPDEREARGHTPFQVPLDRHSPPTRIVLKAHGYADRTVKLDPAKPSPMKVTLDKVTVEKTAREKVAPTASNNAASSSKKKGSDITGGKQSANPSGYKMMGD